MIWSLKDNLTSKIMKEILLINKETISKLNNYIILLFLLGGTGFNICLIIIQLI